MSQEYPYWIQKADLSSQDYSTQTIEEIARVFETHDWDSELALQKALEERREDSCPPGLGVVPGDGRILHVCPNGDGTAIVHYHFEVSTRILWMIPTTKTEIATASSVPVDSIARVFRLFAEKQHKELRGLAV